MTEQPIPLIADDGAHVFSLTSLAKPSGGFYEGAAGEIRWSRRDGLTFRFTVPNNGGLTGSLRIEGATPLSGPGFHEAPTNPAWTGTIAGGGTFQLFATRGRSQNELNFGTGRTRTILIGRAMYCELVLPHDGPLSFFRATPRKPRYFISGFEPCPWPDFYEERFNDGNASISVGCLMLQANPTLRVIRGAGAGVQQGAWLVYEGECPATIRTIPEFCDDARRFLSFLVGRSLPFLWTDRFGEDEQLSRLYFGMPHGSPDVVGYEQPIPLCVFSDVIKYSQSICAKIPTMFDKFRTVAQNYNIDFISSPIWSAFETYADDKLTFACVSLERLSNSHDDFLKKNPELAPKAQEFLTAEQSKAIRKALGDVVKAMADSLNISSEAVRILVEKKINNIHTPPNADKLIQVFTFLGIDLTSEEKRAIDLRNSALHGRRTMGEPTLTAVAEENRRFDVLRTLINRALLRLLEYEGPFVDWGQHMQQKGLAIQKMDPRSHSQTQEGRAPK